MKIIDNMKKIIKKRKAFTLVELMGVLVLLGVLTAILIPVIGNNLKENKENVYNYLISSIELASKNLASDHMFILPTEEGSSVYITLGQLKSLSYIEEVTNPITKKELSDCTLIEIKKTDNNYEYVINENTFENFDCTVNSGISISQPSNEYIKNAMSTDYIVIVNSDDEDMFKKYNINNSKINLIGSAAEGAKYLINGENRIYKISLIGGEIEGTLSFELTSGAITDEIGNDIVGNNPLSPGVNIEVDNTGPTIVFGTDGDNNYKKNLTSIITVSDSKSQVDSTTLKYIYTQDINAEPINNFTNGGKVENSVGNGVYYLRAKACDNAGNCTINTSKTFNLDTQAPVITLARGNYASDEWAGIGFKNGDYTLLGSAEENGSGIAYWQYTYNENASEDNCGDSSKCWISYNNDSIKKNDTLTEIETTKFSSERNQLVYIRACDNVGNCSNVDSEMIKIDLTKPTLSYELRLENDKGILINSGDWYNKSIHRKLIPEDSGSGARKVMEKTGSSWILTSYISSYTKDSSGSSDKYYKAIDEAGNESDQVRIIMNVDKTCPSISIKDNKLYRGVVYGSNPEPQAKISLEITDSHSGISLNTNATANSNFSVAYDHSVDTNLNLATSTYIYGSSGQNLYDLYFGYNGNNSNVLTLNNIIVKDNVGNSTTISATCNYSNNTCTVNSSTNSCG